VKERKKSFFLIMTEPEKKSKIIWEGKESNSKESNRAMMMRATINDLCK
jgi:hypothetical protein